MATPKPKTGPDVTASTGVDGEPPSPLERLRRGLSVGLLSLGLVAFGLVMTGHEGRALGALDRLDRDGFVIGLAPDSRPSPVRAMQTLGGREYTRTVTTWRSPDTVIDFYKDWINKHAAPFPDGSRPYAEMSSPSVKVLSWLDESGWRCGVVAYPELGGHCRYSLFQGRASHGAVKPRTDTAPTLAAGIQVPAGSRALFDVRDSGGNLAFYEVPGSPAEVSRVMERRLTDAGCVILGRERRALDKEALAGRGQMLTLPFRKGAVRGIMTLQRGAELGRTELSVVTHER